MSKRGNPISKRPSVSYELTADGYVMQDECALVEVNAAAGDNGRSEESKIQDINQKTQEFMDKWALDNCGDLASLLRDLKLEKQEDRIDAVVEKILENAVKDPSRSRLIAKEVQKMSQKSVTTLKKFVKKILDKCHRQFLFGNARDIVLEEEMSLEAKLSEVGCDSEEAAKLQESLDNLSAQGKNIMVGYGRFLGELFNFQLFTPSNILPCVESLLLTKDEEFMERICELLSTSGHKLDCQIRIIEQRNEATLKRNKTPKWTPTPDVMNKILAKLQELGNDNDLSPDLRTTMSDLYESGLNNGWKPCIPSVAKIEKQKFELHRAENPWRRYAAANSCTEDQIQEEIARKTRGVMNKLTDKNFEKLANYIVQLNHDNNVDRIGVITRGIIQRVIDEPALCSVAIKMFFITCQHCFQTSKLLRKAILDKVQNEFCNGSYIDSEIQVLTSKLAAVAVVEGDKNLMEQELVDKKYQSRQRRLGIVRIIAELYKYGIVSPKTVENCVNKCLANVDDVSLECACIFLSTVGPRLDRKMKEQELKNVVVQKDNNVPPSWVPRAGGMKNMLEQLKVLSGVDSVSIRIRFALLDIHDLGKRGWPENVALYNRREDRLVCFEHQQKKLFEALEKQVKTTEPEDELLACLTTFTDSDDEHLTTDTDTNAALDPCVSEVPISSGELELEVATAAEPEGIAQSKKKNKKKTPQPNVEEPSIRSILTRKCKTRDSMDQDKVGVPMGPGGDVNRKSPGDDGE